LLVATKFVTAKLHSLYVKEPDSGVRDFGKAGVGVGNFGNFNSDSVTLLQI